MPTLCCELWLHRLPRAARERCRVRAAAHWSPSLRSLPREANVVQAGHHGDITLLPVQLTSEAAEGTAAQIHFRLFPLHVSSPQHNHWTLPALTVQCFIALRLFLIEIHVCYFLFLGNKQYFDSCYTFVLELFDYHCNILIIGRDRDFKTTKAWNQLQTKEKKNHCPMFLSCTVTVTQPIQYTLMEM